MSTRAFSVTVRDHESHPIPGALVCVNDRCGQTDLQNGRVRIEGISTDWHQVQLQAEAEGYALYSESVNLDPGQPPFGDVEWPDLYLDADHDAAGPVRVEGDHFMAGDARWLWKGSTDFRLGEVLLRGGDVRPILEQRQDAGANLVRVLSMKKDNTGWQLDPRHPGHTDMMHRLFTLLGNMGLYAEWTIFADTKLMMPNPSEQQDYYGRQCAIVRQYPHLFLELINEAGHGTQACDPQRFSRPDGILSSHGSGLSDVQPVKPLWHYATYHARRSGGLAKIGSNYSPYVFQDGYPTPCPYVPEETIKPEQYGYDTGVARLMGQAACCGSGGTFHHDAWNAPRLFNEGEFACASAFYRALA
jgi:hypothetical protein